MKTQTGLIALLLAAAGGLQLQATTFYLATTGSDSNTCTSTQPCLTINATYLTFHLNPYDTIAALDGVDMTAGQSWNLGIAVTIDGGSHGAFMTGPNNGWTIALGNCHPNNFVVRNLTFIPGKGANSEAIDLGGNTGECGMISSTVTLQNVTILGEDAQNTLGISAAGDSASVLVLDGVKIIGVAQGLFVGHVGGVAKPTLVRMNNVSIQAASVGATLGDAGGMIRNSAFYNSSTGLSITQTNTAPVLLIDTTEFSNNGIGALIGSGVTARLSNSVITGNQTGLSGSGSTISFRDNTFAGNGTDGPPVLSTSVK